MSKHRAADESLTTLTDLSATPLGQQLAELAERAAAADGADPRFAAVHDHIAQVADAVREALGGLADQQQQMIARYADLLIQLERQESRADDQIAAATAARATLESGAELLADVRAMRVQLQGSTGLLTGAQAVLEAGVRRMQTSGDALVRYLDERDVALEAERDRVLRDVLEDFATSLHARERRTLARRLIDVVDRRRDARDAARWRRAQGGDQRPVLAEGTDAITRAAPRVIDLEAAARRRATSGR